MPNTVDRGFAVVNMVRVRIVVYFLSQCLAAITFFLIFFLLIGLITTPGYSESGAGKGEHLIYHPLMQTLTLNPADRPLMIDYRLSAQLPAQSEYPALEQDASAGDQEPEEKPETVEPITRHLPIWGEQVRQMGFDLPLPFGVGANLVLMDQGIDVRNLKIGTSASNFEVSGVTFSNTRAHDRANTARLDMWLLPFFNAYGVFGYINGEAELDVNVPAISVDLPIIGNIPITDAQTHKLNIDYNGTTYGGGITLAGGYKNFFVSLDANYTYSKRLGRQITPNHI